MCCATRIGFDGTQQYPAMPSVYLRGERLPPKDHHAGFPWSFPKFCIPLHPFSRFPSLKGGLALRQALHPFLFGVGGHEIGCGSPGDPACLNHSNSLIHRKQYFKAGSSHLWNRPGASTSLGEGQHGACRLRGVADCCQGTNSQVCFHPRGSEGFPNA